MGEGLSSSGVFFLLKKFNHDLLLLIGLASQKGKNGEEEEGMGGLGEFIKTTGGSLLAIVGAMAIGGGITAWKQSSGNEADIQEIRETLESIREGQSAIRKKIHEIEVEQAKGLRNDSR